MVTPLPDWLVTQQRGVQRAARMDQSCSIKRKSSSSNGAGGTISTETTLGPYPCAIGPAGRGIGEMLAARKVVVTGLEEVITLEVTVSVLMTDKLAIGGDEFEVVDIAPTTSRQTAREIVVRRQG